MKKVLCYVFTLFCLSTASIEAHQLVDIEQYIPDVILDIRYATEENFLNEIVYKQPKCFVHKKVAKALKKVAKELALHGFKLKIFDGYRPLSVQKKMWDLIQDERYVANPAVNSGTHTRGTAVDITIVDSAGNDLRMPTEFDDFSEKAHSDYDMVNPLAKSNREFLKNLMEKHSFKQLDTEWWHFDYIGWDNDDLFPPLDISFEDVLKELEDKKEVNS
jgi:zinc D-Ala-D-Ala dipeptidase